MKKQKKINLKKLYDEINKAEKGDIIIFDEANDYIKNLKEDKELENYKLSITKLYAKVRKNKENIRFMFNIER